MTNLIFFISLFFCIHFSSCSIHLCLDIIILVLTFFVRSVVFSFFFRCKILEFLIWSLVIVSQMTESSINADGKEKSYLDLQGKMEGVRPMFVV